MQGPEEFAGGRDHSPISLGTMLEPTTLVGLHNLDLAKTLKRAEALEMKKKKKDERVNNLLADLNRLTAVGQRAMVEMEGGGGIYRPSRIESTRALRNGKHI